MRSGSHKMKSMNTNQTSNLDFKLNRIAPGGTLYIGGSEKCWSTAERSGDGKTLRFVRHTPNGFEVFKTSRF